MGDCKYCGKPVGFLRSKHAECDQQFENGKAEILAAISGAIAGSGALENLPARITSIAQRSYIADPERHSLLALGWTSTVDKFLENGVLDASAEDRLMEFKECFSLSQEELDSAGALTRVTNCARLKPG